MIVYPVPLVTPDEIAELQSLGVDLTGGESVGVIRQRVEARAVRVVTSDRAQFSRPTFDRLMAVWSALRAATEKE